MVQNLKGIKRNTMNSNNFMPALSATQLSCLESAMGISFLFMFLMTFWACTLTNLLFKYFPLWILSSPKKLLPPVRAPTKYQTWNLLVYGTTIQPAEPLSQGYLIIFCQQLNLGIMPCEYINSLYVSIYSLFSIHLFSIYLVTSLYYTLRYSNKWNTKISNPVELISQLGRNRKAIMETIC